MTSIEKKQGLSPREKMAKTQKRSMQTTSKVYKPKEPSSKMMFNDLSTYLPKVECSNSSTASSNGSDGKLSPEQKHQLEISSNHSSSFEAQNKSSNFGIECEEFKPKSNGKFNSSVFPQSQSDLDSHSESCCNTTACDTTIEQDNSKMDITMNNSMMDVSIADVQEFKPKGNTLSASLNASSFKPFTPTVNAAAPKSALANNGLDSLELNNDFTPSTPYVHKFRTEICKNFELYGKCKYGDEVSIHINIYFIKYTTFKNYTF